jgi:hypothetical protein
MDRRDDSSWQLFLAICFWMASLLILLQTSYLAWLLKDGLGPDSVESHGLLALGRFWSGIRWNLCVLVIPIHSVGWFFYWLDSRKEQQDFLEQRAGWNEINPMRDAELDRPLLQEGEMLKVGSGARPPGQESWP